VYRFYRINATYSIFLELSKVIVTIYIDDLLLFSLEIVSINIFKEKLYKAFDMTNLRVYEYYLGIHIIQDQTTRTIYLSQEKYIKKVLNKFKIQNSSSVATSIEISLQLTPKTKK